MRQTPIPSLWKIVRARAWHETKEMLFPSWSRLMIAVLLFCIYIAIIWLFGGGQMAGSEILSKLAWSIAPALVFPILYIWNMFKLPNQLFAELRNEVSNLKMALQPRLRLSLPGGSGVRNMEWGGTSESPFSGTRQTQIMRHETVVTLTCTNKCSKEIEDCRAFLIDAREIEEGDSTKSIGFTEHVPLLWSRNLESGELSASIPPGISKSIYIFTQRGNSLLLIYRLTKDLPIEYHQLFQNNRRYRLWIQAHGKDQVADRICLDVFFNEETGTIRTEVKEAGLKDPLL